MARNFVVYESRNRLTGTLMRTLDLRHNDCPPAVKKAAEKQMPGARYAAQCVEHSESVLFEEHYPAGRAIAHPDEWCPGCQAHLEANKPKVTKETSEAYAKAFKDEVSGKAQRDAERKAAREAKKASKVTTPVETPAAETEPERELVEA